jgi:fused signal recognition particle receptor
MSDSTNESADETGESKGWLGRLTGGLKRTSSALGTAITDIVMKGPMDPAILDEIEEALIRSDRGLDAAADVTRIIGEGWYKQSITADEVKGVIADHVAKVLTPVAKPLTIGGARPFVILVVGVNGSGKTTLIGKLAAKLTAEKKKVVLAAGDTFRAAAIDQLKIWGTRTGAQVIASTPGGDAASLAFDAVSQAQRDNADVVIVDTAGRLQNRAELMDELEKIVRVMKKVNAQAPHAVLLVLDATVGQNALSQVELFQKTAGVTGLVMTKLDGTARGGILVAIAQKFGLPIHFIGVGEGVDDLAPFSAKDFGKAVAGVE